MRITISEKRIDVADIPLNMRIAWDQVLDELNAPRVPGLYQIGKRIGEKIIDGKTSVYFYRSGMMPRESEILEILKRHGVE